MHHLIGQEAELTTGITQEPVTTPLDPNSILLQFVKNKNKEEEVPQSSATPSSTESFTIFTTPSTPENKLSAFRALQQQTKSAKIDNWTPEVETGTGIARDRDNKNGKQLSRDPKDYDYKYYESDVV